MAQGTERKFDEHRMKLLEEDLHARPVLTYEKRAEFLEGIRGGRMSKSTICKGDPLTRLHQKKEQWVQAREMRA